MSTNRVCIDLEGLNRMAVALTKAQDLADIKAIRDQAEAIRKYTKSSGLGLDIQNRTAELKLMAERKAGSLLAEMRLRGAQKKMNSHDESLRLARFGIDRNESSRWQHEATVPEAMFKKYVTTANKLGRDITSQGLLRVAKMLRAEKAHTTLKRRKSRASSAGADILNGKNGHSGSSVDHDRIKEIRDGLNEIQGHRSLLEAILEPLCQSRASRLKREEKRIVLQLLTEIETIVMDIGAALSCPSE